MRGKEIAVTAGRSCNKSRHKISSFCQSNHKLENNECHEPRTLFSRALSSPVFSQQSTVRSSLEPSYLALTISYNSICSSIQCQHLRVQHALSIHLGLHRHLFGSSGDRFARPSIPLRCTRTVNFRTDVENPSYKTPCQVRVLIISITSR